jgi:hypothetical protein
MDARSRRSSGFGSRLIAIARVSSSVRRFLSITSTAVR